MANLSESIQDGQSSALEVIRKFEENRDKLQGIARAVFENEILMHLMLKLGTELKQIKDG